MLLLIDNFDSFTYNLVQAFQRLGEEVKVVRNRACSAEEALSCAPSHLILGPGPGAPSGAGISYDCLQRAMGNIPILGVCLGHQLVGEAFGAQIERAERPIHGKTSKISHDGRGVFKNLEQPLEVARYHSLIVQGGELEACAWAGNGEIMALRHPKLAIHSVQFHPESIATPSGESLLQNFLHCEA